MALARTLAARRLYYGWYILGTAFMVNFVTVGMNSYTPAVFLKPMTQELGWSRGFFSLSVSLSGLMSAPLALVVGPLVDRRGGRALMLAGGVAMGAALIALGLVYEKWQFIALRSILAPLAMAGVGQLVTQVTVSNWFIRKRGRALAILAMGMSAGAMVAPPLATFLIAALGWRHAWMVLGLISWVPLLPVVLLMTRRPEDMGLLPDGGAEGGGRERTARTAAPETAWSRRAAVRTWAFWLFTLGFPIGIMGSSAISQHLYSYLTDIHFTPQAAALMTMTLSLAAFLVKPGWGFVSERASPRYCMVAALTLIGVGLGLLLLAGPHQVRLYAGIAFLGVFYGGTIQLTALLWADYFGRMSLGRIQSMAMPISAVIHPLGPVLAGFMWDITGSYRGIFAAYMGTQAVAAVLIWMARPPRHKPLPGLR